MDKLNKPLLPVFVTMIKTTNLCFALNCISKAPAVSKKKGDLPWCHKAIEQTYRSLPHLCGKGWRSEQSIGAAAQGSPRHCLLDWALAKFLWALHGSSSSSLSGEQTLRKKSQVSAAGWLWPPINKPSVGHGNGF